MSDDNSSSLEYEDIYLIQEDGEEALYISYEGYTDENNGHLLEWYDNNGSSHNFFGSSSSGYPANLIGPALTKVIDWNLMEENCTLPPNYTGPQPKNGYYLDLRIVHMARQRYPYDDEDKNQEDTDELENQQTYTKVHHIPNDYTYQLLEGVEENLYIAYWVDPLTPKESGKLYPYKLKYFTADELSIIGDNSGTLPLDPEHPDEYHNEVARSLSLYYRDAGVQIGAVQPDDVIPRDMMSTKGYFICYIANLKSFIR